MNTVKKILRLFVIAFIVMGTLYACEDFLNQPPQGQLDSNVLANQDGVEGNLISAYAMLDGYAGYGAWGTASSNWTFGSVTTDDAYKGSEPGDQAAVTSLELYQWGSGDADGYLNDKWSVTYDGISRANATLDLLASVEEISDSDRQRIRGEAIFLRAHYHFEAWKMWGNIPYYTEEDEDFKKPNTGTNPIQQILGDLDTAIDLLPPSQSDVGRVNEWTAKAYKGRVQVYSGDHAGAISTLNDVVANGPYALEDNYYDVFNAANDNGPETILAYQASVNDGQPGGSNGNYSDRLNFPHSGSPFGCCGFHQPSQNLVNAYKVDATGLPLPISSPNSWNDGDTNPAATTPVDPRLDFVVGRDGVPFLDYGEHAAGWIRDRGYSGQYSTQKTVPAKGHEATSNVGWSSFQLHSQNLHLYRYADLLLLLAEAEAVAGDPNRAIELVNDIRDRAGQAAQGPGNSTADIAVPINDPSITWATYNVGTYPETGWSSADALERVRLERRLELALEGHRLFDLRRWDLAQDVLNNYTSTEATRREYLGPAEQFSDRHSLYPIPSTQINLSEVEGENRLQQNPGW